MSLVNQMLQDLQQRKAAGSKPLAGLHAVPTAMRSVEQWQTTRSWFVVLPVIAIAGAVAALLWWPGEDVNRQIRTSAVSVDAEPQTVALPVSARPMAPVNRQAGFKMNQLDFTLRSPPSAKISVAAVVTAKPPVVSAHTMPKVRTANDTPTGRQDTSAIVVKKPVSAAVRLRRDGLLALRAGRAIAAERLFAELVAVNPENQESYLFLHAALKAQSRTATGRKVLLDGLEHATDPAGLAQTLALELLADGRVDQALSVLTAHRPAGHADMDYEARLAAVNQRAGNHDVAARLYGLLVARQPANGVWWVGLAISQEAIGHASDAATSFATATAGGTLDTTLARYAAQRLEKLESGS